MLPLMANSSAPCAVITVSMALCNRDDEQLIVARLEGDEAGALARADALVDAGAEMASRKLGSMKNAVNRWMRTVAPTDDWVGAGIPIYAVGPGVIEPPMTAGYTVTAEGREIIAPMVPMPLGGYGRPDGSRSSSSGWRAPRTRRPQDRSCSSIAAPTRCCEA